MVLSLMSKSSCSSSELGQIITDQRGRIFDVQEFARGCITVMGTLMFFADHSFIRKL